MIKDGIEYAKADSLSIEEMMKEFGMTREEVISATEEAAIWSTYMICIDGDLYKEKE